MPAAPRPPRLKFSVLGLLTSEADGTFAVAVLAVLVVAVVVVVRFLPLVASRGP